MTTPAVGSVRYLFFALASLAVLMSAIDSTIVAVALPELTTALDAPLTWVAWTLTAYQLVQIVMFPVAGRLSDTLGRKRVFLCCTGAFTLGSLLCGLAPSIELLIGARVLQALGGGGLMPSAVGIISDQFAEQRAQARGLFTSIMPIGGIVGPNLGGFILHQWGWRELFFINVPIGLGVMVGVYFLLRDDRASGRRLEIDFQGIGLFAGGMLALMYGMTTLGNDAQSLYSPWLWALFASSGALFTLFLRHLRMAPAPLVRYDFLVGHPFLAVNLYNFFYGAATLGFFAFVPYYAVMKYGMSAFESGAVLTPRAITMIVVSALASLYIIRLGYRRPMIAGILLVSLTLVLLGQPWTSVQLGGVTVSGFVLLAGILAISGVGMGLSGPASGNVSLDLAPKDAAALTGLRSMFRQMGGAVGIASMVLALSYFPDKGQGITVIYLALAGVMLLTVPLVFVIPDTARERLLARRQRARQAAAPAGEPPAAAPRPAPSALASQSAVEPAPRPGAGRGSRPGTP